jgi:hypothetical protein
LEDGSGAVFVEFETQEVLVDSSWPGPFEPALVDAGSDDIRVVGVDVCTPDGSSDGNFFPTFVIKISAHDLDSKGAVLLSFKSWKWLRSARKAATDGEIAFRD